MKGKLKGRSSVLVVALALGATMGATAPGNALPVVKYKCAGSITYHGHAFQYYNTWLWSWTFDSYGKCVGGFDQLLTYSVSGNSMPGCGGPTYATSSPKEPNGVYLATATVTNGKTGASESLLQQWVGGQINRWDSVPSRYIPIGGITGYAAIVLGIMNTGTWDSPTIKGKVALAFGSQEIPGTDQPDSGAC
jgi:hypothetical protein